MPSIKHSLDALKGLDLNTMYINMQSHGEDNIDVPFRAEHTVTYSDQLKVSAVTIAKKKAKNKTNNKKTPLFQGREQEKRPITPLSSSCTDLTNIDFIHREGKFH